MVKINSICLKSLRNDELYGFCSAVEKCIIEQLKPEEFTMISEFKMALKNFKIALDRNGVDFGDAIRKADERVDQALACINCQLKVNLLHFNPDIREAASVAYRAFAEFYNQPHLTYCEEAARMENVINAVDGLSRELLEKAMIADWVEEFKKRCAVFDKCMNAKHDAKSVDAIGDYSAARNAVYSAYAELSPKISALALLEPTDAHARIITEINKFISKIKQAVKKRQNEKNRKLILDTALVIRRVAFDSDHDVSTRRNKSVCSKSNS